MLASLLFQGQVTKHSTVKWSITVVHYNFVFYNFVF